VGYSTDFIGHVDMTPVLNEQERAYLAAFSDSRRWARPGGPYEVPGNPAAEYDDPTLGPPQPMSWSISRGTGVTGSRA
jgi:hypothetical protein